MSGGQQGGPMMGGGKGGTQQMPAGGGKGGPQGQMMPNGQRQQRPGMGGPMSGNMGQPQRPGISSWQSMTRPGPSPAMDGQGFHKYLQGLQGMNQGQPSSFPQANFGMSQAQMRPLGSPPQQMGTPGQQPAQFQHQMDAMNSGTPGPQYQPQQQPRQLSGLLAKLYGG